MAREEQRPERVEVAAPERVGCGEDARVLADDVARARRAGHLLRGRVAYSDPTSVRGTPQCTTTTAIDAGMATGVISVLRQSISSA